jgi:hypothetical protein
MASWLSSWKPLRKESNNMDRFPDQDVDDNDEPVRSPKRMEDQPTWNETLQEARDFHDDWSRQNPNRVYGQSYPRD